MTRADGPRRGFFDLWSRFYDLPAAQAAADRPVHDAVVARLRSLGCRAVADIGCGTGLLSSRLARELPAVRVVGLDFSAGMLREATTNEPPAPRGVVGWVQGDAQRLPFRDASFDAVVSTESFHWYPDQRAALAEFRRVLAPHGRLLVELINPPIAAIGTLARLASRVGGQPLTWPTRDEMRALVERAGFRVEAQQRIFRWLSPLLLPAVLTVAARADAVPPPR